MDYMRCVANEPNALGDKRAGDAEAERMNTPPADHFDVAKMQLEPPLKFGMERLVRQRHDAFGFRRRFSPDDRGAVCLERQNRERAGGQKMLFRPSLMIAFMRDIDHNRRLAVTPAMGGNVGLAANAGLCAIGGDEKT